MESNWRRFIPALAKNYRVIAIAGDVADDCGVVYQHGIDAVLGIAPGPISLSQSMAESERLIAGATESAIRFFLCLVNK